MPQFGWNLDLRRCVGCSACAVACKAEMNTPPVQSPMTVRHGKAVAVNYRMVYTVDGGSYPAPTRTFVTMSCNHCASPACLPACPVGAITKDATTGIVTIDDATCIGCRYCEWTCPYGAPQFNAETDKVEKCSGCAHRQAAGLAPACATSCPARALNYTADFSGGSGTPPDGFADPALTESVDPLHVIPMAGAASRTPSPDRPSHELSAGLYRLLAGALLAPPTAELLAPLTDPTTADAAEDLLGAAVADRLRELGRQHVDPAALRQEFFDLFAVPTARYVTPFEAVFCDERDVADRPVRGLLGGPSTAAVRSCYERAGFRVAARELPDHVACELAFLGELHGRVATAHPSADSAAIGAFATAHPARWLPELTTRVTSLATSGLYPALLGCAAALVAADAGNVA